MSERDKRPESDDEMLSGAYALDALSGDERERFEALLAGSEDLRAEAAEFADTAAMLGADAPRVSPPASMKANLMSRIAQTPQLSAATPAEDAPDADDDSTPATPVDPVPLPAPGLASAPDVALGGEPLAEAPVGTAERKAQTRWFSRPGAIIASAAAALVLIGGAVVGVGYSGDNGWGAQQDLASITDASDHQSQTVDAAGGGTITVSWSGERDQAAVTTAGLAKLDSSQTYELWYIDESGAVPAGTFDVSGDTAWRVLDGDMPQNATIGVTVEPAGGSKQPTSDPIAAVATA